MRSEPILIALLGGTMIIADLRLLGLLLADVPSEIVVRGAQRLFNVALATTIAKQVKHLHYCKHPAVSSGHVRQDGLVEPLEKGQQVHLLCARVQSDRKWVQLPTYARK